MDEIIKKTDDEEETEVISDGKMAEMQYKKLKLRLEEIQKKREGKSIGIIGIVFAILFSIVFSAILFEMYGDRNFVVCIILSIVYGIAVGLFITFYISLLLEMQESKIRRKMLEFEVEDAQKDVKEDIFENSIKMSYKYLDQYYLQTREQAQKGFLVTVCVAIAGGILIGVGVVAMFFGVTEPSYITCGAGVITEFIAAVFFYLYNKTVSSMSKYHNKLVLSQNISIALKVSDSLPSEDKIKAKNKIIDELLKDVNAYLVKSDSDNEKEK